jgi:hypothetical protein
VGSVVRCGVEHGHNMARVTWGRLDRVAQDGARARRHQGRVAQLAESGQAPGWGSRQVRQPGSSGRADRLLGSKPVKPLACLS